jgi:hypothetical protein
MPRIEANYVGDRRSPEEFGERIDESLVIIPNPKGIDKVYMYIGCAVFLSGSVVIIVICVLIFANEQKNISNIKNNNPFASGNTNNNNNNINETIVNRVKISGFYTISNNNKNETYYQFKKNGNIYFQDNMLCDVLVVGGGGGTAWGGGGLGGGAGTGGGGGGAVGVGKLLFYGNESYSITVGKGGLSGHNTLGTNGEHSTIVGKRISEIAYGGGAGGYYIVKGEIGGSSGGNYGFTGLLKDSYSGYIFDFSNIRPNNALRGQGILTYYGNNGGYGLNNTNKNSGSGGGGAGGPGGSPKKNGSGGKGGEGYLWKVNNQSYGSGGNGGYSGGSNSGSAANPIPYSGQGSIGTQLLTHQVAKLPDEFGSGGGGGSTIGGGSGTGGASGTVIIGNCSKIITKMI